jgi:hypothetical protein
MPSNCSPDRQNRDNIIDYDLDGAIFSPDFQLNPVVEALSRRCSLTELKKVLLENKTLVDEGITASFDKF